MPDFSRLYNLGKLFAFTVIKGFFFLDTLRTKITGAIPATVSLAVSFVSGLCTRKHINFEHWSFQFVGIVQYVTLSGVGEVNYTVSVAAKFGRGNNVFRCWKESTIQNKTTT